MKLNHSFRDSSYEERLKLIRSIRTNRAMPPTRKRKQSDLRSDSSGRKSPLLTKEHIIAFRKKNKKEQHAYLLSLLNKIDKI